MRKKYFYLNITIVFVGVLFSLFFLGINNASAQYFSDNFEGSSLDTSKWDKIVGTASIEPCNVQSNHPTPSRCLRLVESGSASYIQHTFSSPSTSTGTTGIVSAYFYDDASKAGGSTLEVDNPDNTKTVTVGVNPTTNSSNYYYRTGNNNPDSWIDSKIPRTTGWHHFEIVVTPKGSYARIDGISLSWLPSENKAGTTVKAVTTDLLDFYMLKIVSNWTTGTYYWDDLTVTYLPTLPSTRLEKERKQLETFANIPMPSSFYDGAQTARAKTTQSLVFALLNINLDKAKENVLWAKDNYSSWVKMIILELLPKVLQQAPGLYGIDLAKLKKQILKT